MSEDYCGGKSCLGDIAQAVQIVQGKWSPAILETLHWAGSACRFRELQRRIPGISQKELVRHLQHLVNHGVVSRSSGVGAVAYSLTQDGQHLLHGMDVLGRWNQSRRQIASRHGGHPHTAEA